LSFILILIFYKDELIIYIRLGTGPAGLHRFFSRAFFQVCFDTKACLFCSFLKIFTVWMVKRYEPEIFPLTTFQSYSKPQLEIVTNTFLFNDLHPYSATLVQSVQDNTSPHIAKSTPEKLLKLGWVTIPRPPYSVICLTIYPRKNSMTWMTSKCASSTSSAKSPRTSTRALAISHR